MDSWIVGGHYNNLETLEDQQGRGSEFKGIARGEEASWELFLLAIGSRDNWWDAAFRRWQGILNFSWGFGQEGGRLLEQLDQFYINNWVASRGGHARV